MEINSKSDTGDLRIGDIAQDSPLSPPPFPEAPEPVPGSPIPSKAKRLFDEGKISSTEYVTLLTSDKNFHEDEDIDNIPWLRISKDTMEATGPLIVMIEDKEMSPQKRAPSSPLVPPPSPAPPAPTPEKDEPVDRRRLEAERRAAHKRTKIESQRQKDQLRRHQAIAKTTEKWENKILPRWHEVKKSSEVVKLVYQGIPTKYRGKVWFVMIGNSLQIEEHQYLGLVAAAKELTEKAKQQRLQQAEEEEAKGLEPGSLSHPDVPFPEEGGDRQCTMMLIEWDLPRTFPTLRFFHDGGPLHQSLDNVLKAYACYRPDIGYVQGMSYIVGVFLLNMNEYETFVCLANLLSNNRTNMDIYLLHKPAITAYIHCFDFFFEQYLPLLFKHFNEEGIPSETFLLDWYLTVFSKALPLEVAARMWDCYLLAGEVFILRGALGLLRLFAARLATLSMEKILPFLAHVPEEALNIDDLMENIQQIKITPQKYDTIRKQYNYRPMNSVRNEEIHNTSRSQSTLTPSPVTPPRSRTLSNAMKLTVGGGGGSPRTPGASSREDERCFIS